MRYHQHLGVNDCGPACLAIIASHYKLYIRTAEIRKLCKTDAMGTNLIGLITAAEKLGFTAQAFKGEISDSTLNSKLLFPFIAHIKMTYLGNIYDHFVVIKSISKTKVEIWDPNPAENKRIISREEFLKKWTGYVLFLSLDSHFVPKKEKGNLLIKYLWVLTPAALNPLLISALLYLMTQGGSAVSHKAPSLLFQLYRYTNFQSLLISYFSSLVIPQIDSRSLPI